MFLLQVGTFKTTNNSDYGYNWNEFNSTSDAFETVSLTAGPHTIEVTLKQASDGYGIEIDQLAVSFGSNVTMEELACGDTTQTTELAGEGVTESTTGEAAEELTMESREGTDADKPENSEVSCEGEGDC